MEEAHFPPFPFCMQAARALEADAVDLAAGGLEALVRVLRSDAGGAAVAGDGGVVDREKVDLGVHRGVHASVSPPFLVLLSLVLVYLNAKQ